MARPKEFDPGEAMREAMEAFWQRGYHATSVSDLLSEMKLNRGSLYGTFGDKKHLFLAALEEYHRQGCEKLHEVLERPGPAKFALREWVTRTAESCTGEEGLRGCLALKAAMEMAPQDEDVATWVKDVTRDREQAIAKVVKRGQAEGDVPAGLDPRAVARYLIISLAGLRVMGTASPTTKDVREVVELVLRVLD
jgi:TetR/AcrR family transcriptional repressor of nem operon